MSRLRALPKIAKFGADAERELALFEQAVIGKMRGDDDDEHGPFTPTPIQRSTYTAKPWEIVQCDPSDASFGVILPDPARRDCIGAWIGVKNVGDSTNAISVSAVVGNIDGETSGFTTMPRMFQWFYSTGIEWQRGPSHNQNLLPILAEHTADANTVALWQGNPPTNGSGLVDSSGHGLTLALGAGTERYGELGYGREGFMCDGLTYWQRAGSVNDASLNLVGNMTIEAIVRPLVQPSGLFGNALGATVVNYGVVGETGANDNVFWSMGLSDTTGNGFPSATTYPNMAGMAGCSTFWETGAGANSGIDDRKWFPLNQPTHVAIVRSAGGGTVTFYVNGFRQSITTGVPIGTVGGAPGQFVRIGADQNAGRFFTGLVGSVKISNIAHSSEYIFRDAARCLGMAHIGSGPR